MTIEETGVVSATIETKTVEAAARMPSNTTFWTKVSISLEDYNQRFFFICCPKCRKSTGSNPGDAFTCNYCTARNSMPIPRAIVELQLSDETGKLSAHAYGDVADKILNCAATKLMEAIMAGNRDTLKEIVAVQVDALNQDHTTILSRKELNGTVFMKCKCSALKT